MSRENVEVVCRAYEFVARGDMEQLAAFAREHLHPDYEYQSDLAGETFRGLAGALAFVTDVRETFEDYTTEIEELVDAGDQVLVVSRQSGEEGRAVSTCVGTCTSYGPSTTERRRARQGVLVQSRWRSRAASAQAETHGSVETRPSA
jgi:ketosteroid isomerase-like protein